MRSSIVWVRLMPPTVSVILAGSASLPLSLPLATAARTAFSISRCEVTPTVLRNLRTLVLSTSSFMRLSPPRLLHRIYEPPRGNVIPLGSVLGSVPILGGSADGVEHRGAALFQGL